MSEDLFSNIPFLSYNIDESWKSKASCKGLDPDMFFPERGDIESIRAAKLVCNECVVKEDCLNYGVSLGKSEPGIYGGLTNRQRRILIS